jgi:arginase
MTRNITFLINRSEITAGTRGASLGPGAMMTAARKKENMLFGKFPIEEIKDRNSLIDEPIKHAHAIRIEGLIHIYQKLTDQVSSLLKKDRFPIVLAGDHGSAGGTIAGIKAAYPDKRLGVVWIDAHADMHTPYTTPTGNMHGMPLATALNEDNLTCMKNEVTQEVSAQWNELKGMGGISPKIKPEDLVFIGVRDTEAEEKSLFDRLKITNIKVEEVVKLGAPAVVDLVNQKLSDCDIIYVSFDVDSMDPDIVSHGTGTPVENGLTPEQASDLLVGFARNKKLVCLEFVEVNPCLDEKKNTMAETAFDLLDKVVGNLNN